MCASPLSTSQLRYHEISLLRLAFIEHVSRGHARAGVSRHLSVTRGRRGAMAAVRCGDRTHLGPRRRSGDDSGLGMAVFASRSAARIRREAVSSVDVAVRATTAFAAGRVHARPMGTDGRRIISPSPYGAGELISVRPLAASGLRPSAVVAHVPRSVRRRCPDARHGHADPRVGRGPAPSVPRRTRR